ncbi:MAG TPA: VOC family protein [Actinoallomurus sp.]|jgi:catechol 2,3-dioxygenase-like lactoylglutathione lyase family enzyme|nr:VOC family protein [Actinoallomurus sp.]
MTLDHLVYATPDLEESVRQVAKLTGVRPVEGGPHPGLGTRNHLLGLGELRYLEIIGPDSGQPEPERPRPFGIDELTEPRLAAWAVRAADIEARVARSRTLGYDPGPIEPLSRRTPDGEVLRWRLTFPYEPVVPFLIDWGRTPHPARRLPVVPLTAFSGTHPDPGGVRGRLDALGVELDVGEGEQGLVAVLGGTTALT